MRFPLPSSLFVLACTSPLFGQQLGLHLDGVATGTEFGCSIDTIGDLDSDGIPDFIVGASRESGNGTESGAIHVFSAATGTLLFHFYGDSDFHRMGFTVAGVGDLNADGIPDFAGGARRDNTNGFSSGYVRVWDGATGAELFTFSSANRWDWFGQTIAACGDLDGDGFDDLLIGAPHHDWAGPGAGAAFVYSGATGTILHRFYGENPWDMFGWSATSLPDLDGDGSFELSVGSPRNDSGGSDSGCVDIFSGRTGARIHRISGSPMDALGYSQAAMGDTNGDGTPDLALGAMNDYSTQTLKTGHVEIRSLGGDYALLKRFEEESRFEAFASCLASVGDVDGDGLDDIFVGAPYSGDAGSTGLAAGSARLYSGSSGRALYRFSGDSTKDLLGHAVAPAGDVNGDGLADFLVGEPGGNPDSDVYLYYADPVATLSVSGLVSGQTATFTVQNGVPNSLLTFIYSLRGFGTTSFPSGMVLDLAEPLFILGTSNSDNSGYGTLSVPVPSGTTGATFCIQAWQHGGPPPGAATIAIQRTIQ
tara:strand:- start:736 stop:2337 length:1602 start_codon:yes stop_codon:yes gene_type:complete